MKTLNLTLKKKWFDMILSGQKKEEYRVANRYWTKIFCKSIHKGVCELQHRHYIIFKNGHSKKAPQVLVECNKTLVGYKGKKKWGFPDNVICFTLKLGDIIATKNIK